MIATVPAAEPIAEDEGPRLQAIFLMAGPIGRCSRCDGPAYRCCVAEACCLCGPDLAFSA
jgi:hypothetical protein